MGRPQAEVDMEMVLDLLERGEKPPAIASELGISPPTLRKRIADIQQNQGLLLQYRAIQSLQLTELQARVLEAITPQKIDEAGLADLVRAYKILKDKETDIEEPEKEVKGLVAHLIHLEKQEAALREKLTEREEAIGAEYEEEENSANLPAPIPQTKLSDLDKDRF